VFGKHNVLRVSGVDIIGLKVLGGAQDEVAVDVSEFTVSARMDEYVVEFGQPRRRAGVGLFLSPASGAIDDR
jgi:hypothetical protein